MSLTGLPKTCFSVIFAKVLKYLVTLLSLTCLRYLKAIFKIYKFLWWDSQSVKLSHSRIFITKITNFQARLELGTRKFCLKPCMFTWAKIGSRWDIIILWHCSSSLWCWWHAANLDTRLEHFSHHPVLFWPSRKSHNHVPHNVHLWIFLTITAVKPHEKSNRMAWQWAETRVEIRGTLEDIRGTTK